MDVYATYGTSGYGVDTNCDTFIYTNKKKKFKIGSTKCHWGQPLNRACYIYGYVNNSNFDDTATREQIALLYPHTQVYTNLEYDITKYEYVCIHINSHQNTGCKLSFYEMYFTDN